MKCPCCGADALSHDARDVSYTFKGKTTFMPSVTGDFCSSCGEVVLSLQHGDCYSELIGLFQRRVNSAFPEGRVKLGSLLSEIGREAGGVDLETHRDRTPSEPLSFE